MDKLLNLYRQISDLSRTLAQKTIACDAIVDNHERFKARIELAKIIGELTGLQTKARKLENKLNLHTVDMSWEWDRKEEERRERHDV